MAFTGFLRAAAGRGAACPLYASSISTRLCARPVTILRGTSSVSQSFGKQQTLLSKIVGLPTIRNIKVQAFSTSPKTFSAAAHNHSKIWTIERVLSAALLFVVPAALISPCKLFDTLAAVALVMHTHWGIEATVVDYIRPILFGNAIPKIALGSVYVLSIVTLAGLFQLIYNDIGFANTVRKIWSL